MHGLPVSCLFNLPNANLKQQSSHIGVFICYQNVDAKKKKLNLHIQGVHLLNPYKTVVSHFKGERKVKTDVLKSNKTVVSHFKGDRKVKTDVLKST